MILLNLAVVISVVLQVGLELGLDFVSDGAGRAFSLLDPVAVGILRQGVHVFSCHAWGSTRPRQLKTGVFFENENIKGDLSDLKGLKHLGGSGI